ncbi:stress response protein nst1-like [Panicum hallii]|uniref:stress response protein nst1-like n=1 Tax=Panicum hallii TaxID=206008 RepID=UPI000DF4E45D|nr:stress response protein nst1-like [Panicum hallii]
METAAAASEDEAGPSPAEPAAEGAAAMAEAAAPEAAEVVEIIAPEAAEAVAPEAAEEAEATAPGVAEVASSSAPPAEEEEETEVVVGRRLLPSTAEIPLPRLIAKCHQAQQELEAGMRREWEKLEAERHRLSDWEVRLGDHINSVSARYAEERAKLVLGRELLQEELEQAHVREAAALQREKEARRREAEALKGLIAVEERMEAVADRERTARELAAEVRRASAIVEAEKSTLADLAAAVAKREEGLAAREAEESFHLILQDRARRSGSSPISHHDHHLRRGGDRATGWATGAVNLQLTLAMTTPAPGSSTREESTSVGPVTAAPAPELSAPKGSTPAESTPGADATLPNLPPPELQQVETEAGGEEQVGVPVASPTDGAGTHQTPPEEAAGTSRRPGELRVTGSGRQDIIATNLVDDPLLTANNIENFKKNVITHSQKKSEKLKTVVSGHQELAALEKRLTDERTMNCSLEKANSELREQLEM